MRKRANTTPKEVLPPGTLINDINFIEWKILNIICCGGFGYVYCG
jgi:hypothetical protein